jgi:hypothetical protein
MCSRPSKWLAAGTALALALLAMTHLSDAGLHRSSSVAAAQPRPGPAGIAVNGALVVGGWTAALASIRFSGQVNVDGNLNLNAGSSRRPNAGSLRRVGDQGYVAVPPGIWQSSPLASLIR